MSYLVGLTGGIATGKTTVAKIIANKYPVIDADTVVHQLQKKGGLAYDAMVEHWGNNILDDNQEINRAYFGEIIFNDPHEREQLNRLIDPLIRKEIFAEIEKLKNESIVFLDIPLLFEKSYQNLVDEIWLVYLTKDKQIERLVQRNQITNEMAKNRIATQMPIDEKKALADFVIDNSNSIERTMQQVMQLLHNLEAKILE